MMEDCTQNNSGSEEAEAIVADKRNNTTNTILMNVRATSSSDAVDPFCSSTMSSRDASAHRIVADDGVDDGDNSSRDSPSTISSGDHMNLDGNSSGQASPKEMTSSRECSTELNMHRNHSSSKFPSRRSMASGSDETSNQAGSHQISKGTVDVWGWFDDDSTEGSRRMKQNKGLLDFSTMEILPLNDAPKEKPDGGIVTAPTYVLEESLSSQKLWKSTAGNRPPQPVEERAFFEQMWAENFEKSSVEYNMPTEVLKATSPIAVSPFTDNTDPDSFSLTAFHALSNRISSKHHEQHKAFEADVMQASIHSMNIKNITNNETTQATPVRGGKDGEFKVFMSGDNVFGTTVSKSFARPGGDHHAKDSVSISIAKYRVVQQKNGLKFAQYLVVFCIGDFRNTMGVWKRFSDFEKLSQKVATEQDGYCLAVDEDHEREVLPNAVTSWRLLKKRQRWFRCLDAGYLSLKVFLLERFLHDVLFESSTPEVLSKFICDSTIVDDVEGA